mgnify:CR=1 FL=1|jgi:hypothetical protein
MIFKTTKKEVIEQCDKIIKVGNNRLQALLNYEHPIAYTLRREGKGADIYEFGKFIIVMGNDPFGNIQADYDLCQEYEEKAQEIINSRISRPDTELKKLINLFIINVQVKNNKKEG